MVSTTTLASFRHVSRRLVFCAALACAGATAHAADHWIVGKSEHFEMYSSDSEAASKRILTSLEEFRANFLKLFPLRGASEPRATVVVFESDSAFRPYKPLYQGKPKEGIAGYFIPDPDEVTIAMTSENRGDNSDDSDPRRVIYHEYVHLLLNTRDAKYPLWLNEGLAEVFSTFNVEDGKVQYGRPVNQHVALLQHSSLLPLPQLFGVTHESPDYNEDDRAGIFYAESWALTHYLLFGKEKSNSVKLGKFSELLARGYDVDASFHEVFGTEYKNLEYALRAYLDGGGYYQRGTPAVAKKYDLVFRPATGLERDFALLNLRWRVHRNDDAAAGALALLQKNPNQARPHELLAEIALAADDRPTALEHWRKAAELNSDNPWVYVQLLRDALSPYQGISTLDARLSADQIGPWRTWAGRALALSPENNDAIELALWVEALAEKMDLRVVGGLQGRVANMREPSRALLALAIVHWRVNQPDSVRTLLRLVEAQPKADMMTRAVANALQYRLPPLPEASANAAGAAAQPDPAHAGIALASSRVSETAKYVDELLANNGSTAARVKLDPMIVRGEGRQPDAWRRAEELRKKAAAGDADAMFALAVAHACGEGVEFSPTLATEWLQKAADHGNAVSKAGFAPGKIEPELIAQYLRGQRPAGADSALPPLEADLKAQIGTAATAADRHPPVVVYRAPARFPEALRRSGKRGEAVVDFTIRADGHPDNVKATQFSDEACASAAETCVRGWRFIPTIRDGAPASTLVEVSVQFESAAQSGDAKPRS